MSNAVTAPEQLTFIEIDFAAGRVRTGPGFTAVTGCTAAPAEGLDLATARKRGLSAVAPAERPRVADAIAALLRRPAALHLRFDAVGDDGRQRAIESVWSLEAGADGKPLRAVVTCVDSGARMHADRTLRESEARYRSALQAGRIGSWETDLVAGTRTWSQEGMALFGLDLEGGRGRVGGDHDEYRNALLPQDRHLVARFHELADTLDSFAAEYRIARPDGKTLWLSGRGLVVARQPSGKAHRLISIMADVTERREAEEVLRTERERLTLALEAGQMGAFDYDLANDQLWWSTQMYDLFGVAPETFRPTRESVIELLHPDAREAFIRERAASIANRRPLQLEFRIVRPGGDVAWVSHRGRTEYDAEGQPVRTFGVATDITERKRAEEALREADRKKDHFIATLAHELRNPLAPIRSAVGVLRLRGGGDEQTVWCRDVIDRQVAQMARLLDDLLDVSRISGGQLQLRLEPVEIAAAVEQAVEIAQPLIEAAGHRLAVTLPGEAVALEGDLTRLAQVLSNLLINAAKYTPPGGRIVLTARVEGPVVAVSVSDSGIGIAPENLPRIFEMFGQVESALERSQGGLGIGLSLARGLVEMHGGTIEARSDGPGRGSEFVVRLPSRSAARGGTPDAAVPAQPAPPLDGSCRVLIADDLHDSADSLAALLESMGHEVHVAYDGAEALRVAEAVRPGVALLDIGMPVVNGYAACEQLRRMPWAERMTIIAQTGWGQEEDRRRTREAGFDHHLVKPLDVEALDVMLRRIAAVRGA